MVERDVGDGVASISGSKGGVNVGTLDGSSVVLDSSLSSLDNEGDAELLATLEEGSVALLALEMVPSSQRSWQQGTLEITSQHRVGGAMGQQCQTYKTELFGINANFFDELRGHAPKSVNTLRQ